MLHGDPRFYNRLRRLAMLLWVVVGVMYLAMAIPSGRAWVQTIDDQVLTMAVNAEASALVGTAEVLTTIGGNALTLTFVLIVAGFLYWRNRKTAALLWVGAVVVSEAIIWASKFAYGRPRPPLALVATHSYSFPSGHAGTAAAVAAGVVLMLALRPSRHWYVGALAVTYVIAVSWSRVYLRAHWLSDVVPGAALGAAVAISTLVVALMLVNRRRSPAGDDKAIAA